MSKDMETEREPEVKALDEAQASGWSSNKRELSGDSWVSDGSPGATLMSLLGSNGIQGQYMDTKKKKLEQQFMTIRSDSEVGEKRPLSSLFEGIAIHVNGYTNPSADQLKQLMAQYGGKFDQYYSKKETTLTIASNLAFAKIRKLTEGEKVVRPEWVTKSIAAQRLLPVRDYLLYIPGKSEGQVTLTQMQPSSSTSRGVIPTKRPTSALEVTSSGSLATGTSAAFETNGGQSSSRRTCKAGDDNFVSEFFNRSRLHHISNSVNDFKYYVEELRRNHEGSYVGRQQLKETVSCPVPLQSNRVLMHIDMDCFFVSVGLKKRPNLVGKPVAVTHAKTGRGPVETRGDINFERNFYANKHKRKVDTSALSFGDRVDLEKDDIDSLGDDSEMSEDESSANEAKREDVTVEGPIFTSGSFSTVACCSYEARQSGVKNGMHLGAALQLCPDLVAIPYDFEEYSKVSKALYDVVASYSLDIEAVSCDEMFVDVTEVLRETGASPETFAHQIRSQIKEASGCSASAGLAPNLLLAKLASKAAKPDGHFYLSDDESKITEFMARHMVRDLPGVGHAAVAKLKDQLNVESCTDLTRIGLNRLRAVFGEKRGQKLFDECRGKDTRSLNLDQTTSRKSVSAEINYGMRFSTCDESSKFVMQLAQEVANRLDKIHAKGQQITLKLKIRSKDAPAETVKFMGNGVCDNLSKSSLLKTPTNDCAIIGKECCEILKGLKVNVSDLRGIGIQMSKLELQQSKKPALAEAPAQPNQTLLNYFNKRESLPEEPETREERDRVVNETQGHSQVSSSESDRRLNEAGNLRQDPLFPGEFANLPPSLAMIDEETLWALPEEIRREIMQSYGANSDSGFSSGSRPTDVNAGGKAGRRQATSKSSKKVQLKTTREGPLDKMFRSMSANKSGNLLDLTFGNNANLCGETTTQSVIALIKEWIETEEELVDEDVAYVMKYFLDLVDQKAWEQLKQVSDAFYTSVSGRSENTWKEAYNTIVLSVESEMKALNLSASQVNIFTMI